jgi:uncharacterized protein (TIRG00374 family)
MVAALGVCLYMGIAIAVDAHRLAEALLQLGWIGCGLVLALSALNYLLRFHRWQTYIARLGGRLSMRRHLLYYLGGFAFTVSPGKAGEAVRSLYLRDHDISYSQSLAAFFVERLLDLLSIVLLASLVVLSYHTYRPLIGAVLALVLLALVVVSRASLPGWVETFSAKHSGRIAQLAKGFANLLRSADRLLKPRLLCFGTVLGLVAWGAEGLGFYIICQGLHIELGPMAAIGIYSVAALAGSAAFFLPGGIGGMELVMTSLLVDAGASVTTGVIATLMCRLATLWFAVLIGVVAASTIEFSTGRARAQTVS